MKNSIFSICWSRKKGKTQKNGTTYVVCETLSESSVLFMQQYSDRVIESIYKEGDDIIIPGLPVLSFDEPKPKEKSEYCECGCGYHYTPGECKNL